MVVGGGGSGGGIVVGDRGCSGFSGLVGGGSYDSHDGVFF